jgi:threonyl-tRNA synthetase
LGGKEAEAGTVGVRSRDRGELGAMPVEEFIAMVKKEISAIDVPVDAG